MHDSELIRCYTLDRAGIMFVTDLIRDILTRRWNAIVPEMDVITTLTYLATGKMQYAAVMIWVCYSIYVTVHFL